MKIEIGETKDGFVFFQLIFPDSTVESFPMTHMNSLLLYKKLGEFLKEKGFLKKELLDNLVI